MATANQRRRLAAARAEQQYNDWVERQEQTIQKGWGVSLRASMSPGQPGFWSQDHWEQTQHYTGWNYVALRAIGLQLSKATVAVYQDLDDEELEFVKCRADGGRLHVERSMRLGRIRKSFDDSKVNQKMLPKDHRLVRMLQRPSAKQAGATFRMEQALQLGLTGVNLVWMCPNMYGLTVERYVIPTALATPMPPDLQYPNGAWKITPLTNYNSADEGFVDVTGYSSILGKIIPAEVVEVIRWPHPLYKGDGYGALAGGAWWSDASDMVDRARWAQMRRGANPSLLVSPGEETDPDEADMERMSEKLNARYSGADKTGVIMVASPGTTVEALSHTAMEMGYNESANQLRDCILALHGVPGVAAGVTDGGSYAAFYASLKQFTSLTIQPMLNIIAEEDTEQQARLFGKGLVVVYTAQEVNDSELFERELQTDISAGVRRVNEIRAARGLDPIEGPDGERMAMGGGKAQVQGSGPMDGSQGGQIGASGQMAPQTTGMAGPPRPDGFKAIDALQGGQSGQRPDAGAGEAVSGQHVGVPPQAATLTGQQIAAAKDVLSALHAKTISQVAAIEMLVRLGFERPAAQQMCDEQLKLEPPPPPVQIVDPRFQQPNGDGTPFDQLQNRGANGKAQPGNGKFPPQQNGNGKQQSPAANGKGNVPPQFQKKDDDEQQPKVAPKKKGPHSYSSTQLMLPVEIEARVRAMSKRIEKDDLASEGREDEPHITVLYGLHTNNPDKVKRALAGVGPIKVRFGQTNLFAANESDVQRGLEAYDVVKLDISSPQLVALHTALVSLLPHTSTHPVYQPHVTLAYCLPGAGEKYEGMDDLEGTTAVLDRLIFSDQDGNQTEVRLRSMGTRKSNGESSNNRLDKEFKKLRKRIESFVPTRIAKGGSDCGDGSGGFQPGNNCAGSNGDGSDVPKDDSTHSYKLNGGISLDCKPSAIAKIANALGKHVTPTDVVALCGVPYRCHAHLGFNSSPNVIGEVSFENDNETIMGHRILFKNAIDNDRFFIDKKLQHQGIGTQMLATEVQAARKLGIQRIQTHAGGMGGKYPDNESVEKMNGYYTWPVLGYDAPIGEVKLAAKGILDGDDKSKFMKTLDKKFPNAKRLSDVVSTPAGRKWWKANGIGCGLAFDTSPNSRSSKILDAYIKSKGLSLKVGGKSYSDSEETAGKTDADFLSEPDEVMLDTIWNQVITDEHTDQLLKNHEPAGIAALHAQLENVTDLNEAKALVSEYYGAIRKYSEDQPRDEHGRFADSLDVSASAVSPAAPEIQRLNDLAAKGNTLAAKKASDIARRGLHAALSGVHSANVRVTDAIGMYAGQVDVSTVTHVTFDKVDKRDVFRAIGKFGRDFHQEEVYVRGNPAPNTGLGYEYSDGSYNTISFRLHLAAPLSMNKVQTIIDKSGLYGLTVTKNYLEAYYVGNPKDEAERYKFAKAVSTANQLLGRNGRDYSQRLARFWALSRDGRPGTTQYERVGNLDLSKIFQVKGITKSQQASLFDMVSLYGPSGDIQQRRVEGDGSTSFYGPSGELLGRAVDMGDSTHFYGPAGEPLGRVQKDHDVSGEDRDDHGRWTDGGGGDATDTGKPATPAIAPINDPSRNKLFGGMPHGQFKVNPAILAAADEKLKVVPKDAGQLKAYIHDIMHHPYYQEVARRTAAYGKPDDLWGWSLRQNSTPDGKLTPEREKLHEEIANSFLNPKAVAASGKKPIAFILLGTPASGKTTGGLAMAKKLGVEFTDVSPDDIKAKLPEYEGWNAQMVQGESCQIAKDMVLPRAIEARQNIRWESTGLNADDLKKKLTLLGSQGYDVHLCNVMRANGECISGAWNRFANSNAFGNDKPDQPPGRFVDLGFVNWGDHKSVEAYNAAKDLPFVKGWMNVDMTGNKPVIVEQGSKD